MKLGISTYTYTWAFGIPGQQPEVHMDPFGLIDKAADFGIDCVQIADNFDLSALDSARLSVLASYAAKKNIEIEAGSRGLTEENLDRCIDVAKKLSSPILRMVIDQKDYKPAPDTVISIIRNAASKLASQKITLVLENHDRLPSIVFREIIEKSGTEFAAICLDCVNSMGIGEGLQTVIENLAPLTVNLHVKDFSVKRLSHMMGFLIEGKPAGQGFLELPLILEKLNAYGKCRSAILELWTPPATQVEETLKREEEWATESIVYLKKIMKP
ncbi:MAG TPA: TIM barrel protein [Bacteroidales bacterium]|nr:TIM barrel protein [Bacteroidales bacterium]